MKLDLSYEELHILEFLLAEGLKHEKYTLEQLEKFDHDFVYDYQKHRIALMNGVLNNLEKIYKKSFEQGV